MMISHPEASPRNPVHRRILTFGLFLFICGSLSALLRPFLQPDSGGWQQIIGILHPIEIQLSSIAQLHRSNLLNIIYYAMLLTGIIRFSRQGRDDSGLLRFCLSLLILHSVLRICSGLYVMLGGFELPAATRLLWICRLLYHVGLIVGSWLSIKYLLGPFRRRDAEQVMTFARPVKPGLRFLHLAIDLLVVSLFVYPLFMMIPYGIRSTWIVPYLITIIFAVVRFGYYLLFERMGHATPAKFLTGTFVVMRPDGTFPSAADIVLRTFCRFIPFEALSFLGREGWHDSFSKTTVINEPGRSYSRSKHWWWLALLFLAGVAPPVEKYLQGEMHQSASNKLEQSRKENIVANLSSQHVIVLEKLDGGYRDPYPAIKITEVRDDSLVVSLFSVPRNVVHEKGGLEQYIHNPDEVDLMISKDGIRDAFLQNGVLQIKQYDGMFQYSIHDIFSVGIPVIRKGSSTRNTRSSNGECSKQYQMILSGRSVRILGIRTTQGKVTWTDAFPMVIELTDEQPEGIFTLTASFSCSRQSFVAELEAESLDGKKVFYSLLGSERELVVQQKY